MVGDVNAMLVLGMAIGGVMAGSLTRSGREKWHMVLVPLLCAPAIALFPLTGPRAGGALAVIGGVGAAAMVPVTISLGQRLLPHRTSLVSGLLLGGAWAVAILGPVLADHALRERSLGLGWTFAGVAVLLALSGLSALPFPRRLP
jgi:FSR family fosmidomycin resistance protein-like MFS transporter